MLQRFGKGSGAKAGCECQEVGFNRIDSPESEGGVSSRGLEEGLECPVCWESFDDGDNTPYVLWCGHSLCKNCVLSLQWAVIKLPGLPLQLPLFISCPWCQFLTFRFTWKAKLKYPCKNFFLLWIVESTRIDSGRHHIVTDDTEPAPVLRPPTLISPRTLRTSYPFEQRYRGGPVRQIVMPVNRWGISLWRQSVARAFTAFLLFTSKLPLVLLFLFIVIYVLPFSTLVLALYCLVTILFAVPSFLVVYFSYPSLDWLAREIVS